MPTYDYRCSDCDAFFEASHSMSERPEVECPECDGVDTRKQMSAPFIASHETLASQHFANKRKERDEQTADLRENYGVHDVKPLQGQGYGNVYEQVKRQGGLVKEKMARRMEESERRRVERVKEFRENTAKVAPERTRKLIERRERKAAEDRAINL